MITWAVKQRLRISFLGRCASSQEIYDLQHAKLIIHIHYFYERRAKVHKALSAQAWSSTCLVEVYIRSTCNVPSLTVPLVAWTTIHTTLVLRTRWTKQHVSLQLCTTRVSAVRAMCKLVLQSRTRWMDRERLTSQQHQPATFRPSPIPISMCAQVSYVCGHSILEPCVRAASGQPCRGPKQETKPKPCGTCARYSS
jgi:hypothetical protein